jgi:hypothetical protein
VTIAMLERFAQASRRCDPATMGIGADETLAWDLAARPGGVRALARHASRAATGWLGVPPDARWSLLRACLRTGGARTAALMVAPELLRRVREGDVEAVGCFSTKDFPLATFLAARTRSGCREVLARGTQYFGEFAFELLAVVPYAYWLHRQARLDVTVACADTRSLYYFSPRHEERPVERGYVPITEYPIGRPGWLRYDRTAFPATLDTRQWLPPPYRSVYQDDRFRWSKPTCIVCNKMTDEQYLWHREPTNFMDAELLLSVIGRLRERYQVIYNRPRASDIVNDHQTIREPGDIEKIRNAYPDVLTIQDLHARHPALGFNELQLRLFAGCEKFVSVLGGSSYLASYFGGTNVVYARRGWEVAADAYRRCFGLFSGARVIPVGAPRQLLEAVERDLL